MNLRSRFITGTLSRQRPPGSNPPNDAAFFFFFKFNLPLLSSACIVFDQFCISLSGCRHTSSSTVAPFTDSW